MPPCCRKALLLFSGKSGNFSKPRGRTEKGWQETGDRRKGKAKAKDNKDRMFNETREKIF